MVVVGGGLPKMGKILCEQYLFHQSDVEYLFRKKDFK